MKNLLTAMVISLAACSGSSTPTTTTTTTTTGSGGGGCNDLCTQLAPDCGIPTDQCMQQCANLTAAQIDCMWKAGCDQNAQNACINGSSGNTTSSGGTTSGDSCAALHANHYNCTCAPNFNVSGCVGSGQDACQTLCGNDCTSQSVCN